MNTSPTDRELLEAAAKAAGMTLGAWHGGRLAFMYRDASPGPGYWNPINDNGDAFRLAVKLDLLADGLAGHYDYATDAEYAADPLAATRRAIVRAAAKIGKENQN
jgi:hypothetical protein